jgi:hypothetical protein
MRFFAQLNPTLLLSTFMTVTVCLAEPTKTPSIRKAAVNRHQLSCKQGLGIAIDLAPQSSWPIKSSGIVTNNGVKAWQLDYEITQQMREVIIANATGDTKPAMSAWVLVSRFPKEKFTELRSSEKDRAKLTANKILYIDGKKPLDPNRFKTFFVAKSAYSIEVFLPAPDHFDFKIFWDRVFKTLRGCV